MASFAARRLGAAHTAAYRVFVVRAADGVPVSPFHDVPLRDPSDPHNVVTMVCEIPRWSNAKLEISKQEFLNPIKQDQKKGALRFVNNVFPHHGYPWNYGALPQTWDDPRHTCKDTGARGDNDPVDVCEIGNTVRPTGAVRKVKVLGVLAMIDEGETDWKVIAIDVTDPLAAKLNDISDVERVMPGLLSATRDWFRLYKVPTGKPENSFAFNGEYKSAEYAVNVINESHAAWKALLDEGHGDISLANVVLPKNKNSVSTDDARVSAAVKGTVPIETGSKVLDPAIEEVFFAGKL